MELTLEQVEKVRKYAGVSFEEAQSALLQSGGCPLDAVILLEQQGKAAPVQGGSWSTRLGTSPPAKTASRDRTTLQCPRRRKYTGAEVAAAIRNFLRNCTKISVDIWRNDDLVVGIPLVVCVLLFIVAYYIMIPLAILGLMLRCRYHFSGWEGSTDGINRTMDQISSAVADWAVKLKGQLKEQYVQHKNHKK